MISRVRRSSAADAPTLILPAVEPWLPQEKLQKEYDAIGFFLSGHPLDGYAAALMGEVAARIEARGETPFLHVYPHNTGAIRLYEHLGWAIRREMKMTALRPG